MISNLENLTNLFDEFYLVNESVLQPPKENENTPIINLDGKKQSELMFVFSSHLQGVDAEMLHNLVHNAMKLNREVVSFMYLSDNQSISFGDVIKITSVKRIIIWGEPQWAGQEAVVYVPNVQNGVKYLLVETPSVYHSNIQLKTKLWAAIQLLIQE